MKNKYECKCKPTQTLPHITYSGKFDYKTLCWNYETGKNKILFWFETRLSSPTTCDNKKVPIRKYVIRYLFGIKTNIKFGKRIII